MYIVKIFYNTPKSKTRHLHKIRFEMKMDGMGREEGGGFRMGNTCIPTPVFWPGKFHGLYSPWVRKELDTTERLSLPHPLILFSRMTSSGINNINYKLTVEWFLRMAHSWSKVILLDPSGTSLMAQWIRICLPMQGTWVWSLVLEDPTFWGATDPVGHNYWALTLEPTSCSYWSPCAWSLCSATREASAVRSLCTATESRPHSPQLEKWRPSTVKNKQINE